MSQTVKNALFPSKLQVKKNKKQVFPFLLSWFPSYLKVVRSDQTTDPEVSEGIFI